MRRRIKKGVLVGSTDKYRSIKARRLVIEVIYTFSRGVISEKTISIRENFKV